MLPSATLAAITQWSPVRYGPPAASRANSTRMPFSSASSVPAGGTGMPLELADALRLWKAEPFARRTVPD